MFTRLKRLPFVVALGALVAGLAGAAPALSQSADVLELKLAIADGAINPTPDSVLQLADKLGFYAKHGLKVDIVQLNGTPQAVAALNSGAVDLADISIDSAIRLRADSGLPIRGIVSSSLGVPFLIAAKSEIKTPADLVGKSYAIANRGSLDQSLTQAVLSAKGIATDGPNWVPIGPPAARVQALAAGRVDATTVSYGTYLSIKDAPGISVLVSSEDFAKTGPELSKFVAALERTIASKHEALPRARRQSRPVGDGNGGGARRPQEGQPRKDGEILRQVLVRERLHEQGHAGQGASIYLRHGRLRRGQEDRSRRFRRPELHRQGCRYRRCRYGQHRRAVVYRRPQAERGRVPELSLP